MFTQAKQIQDFLKSKTVSLLVPRHVSTEWQMNTWKQSTYTTAPRKSHFRNKAPAGCHRKRPPEAGLNQLLWREQPEEARAEPKAHSAQFSQPAWLEK